MAPLNDFRARGWSGDFEDAIFATRDAERITEVVADAVASSLGTRPVDITFYEVSTALVFGFMMPSQDQVVVRVTLGHRHLPYLTATRVVQSGLAPAWSCVPRPLAGPFLLGGGIAIVDAFLPAPDPVWHPEPSQRGALATGLVDFISACDGYRNLDALRRPIFPWPPEDLWGPPMRPGINLHRRGEGAGWIDEIARRSLALAATGAGTEVVGHGDWLSHNVRLDGDAIVAVYDWDCVALAPEPFFVGKACVSGGATDAEDFVSAYGRARGTDLESQERRLAFATAGWMLAFLARWEHSVDSADTGLRDHLRADGERMLDLADAR